MFGGYHTREALLRALSVRKVENLREEYSCNVVFWLSIACSVIQYQYQYQYQYYLNQGIQGLHVQSAALVCLTRTLCLYYLRDPLQGHSTAFVTTVQSLQFYRQSDVRFGRTHSLDAVQQELTHVRTQEEVVTNLPSQLLECPSQLRMLKGYLIGRSTHI